MTRAATSLGRVVVNSTVGVLGFVDVASNLNMPKYNEDFGQTLGTWGLKGLRIIDRRADLLAASKVLEQAALDPYSFVRDAYLQRRRSDIHDGNPPPDELEEAEVGESGLISR
jgi:phospholipid-binding lipoprotein MlaA